MSCEQNTSAPAQRATAPLVLIVFDVFEKQYLNIFYRTPIIIYRY